MAFNFPASPSNGQEFTPPGGPTYVYNGYAWDPKGGGGASIVISDTAPSSPTAGMLWYESDTGNTYIWYTDVDSSQWVQINTAGGQTAGSGGSSAAVISWNMQWSTSPMALNNRVGIQTNTGTAPYMPSNVNILSFAMKYTDGVTNTNIFNYLCLGSIIRIAPQLNPDAWDEFVLLSPPYTFGAGVSYGPLFNARWRFGANNEIITSANIIVTYIGQAETAVDDNLFVNPLLKVSQQNGDTAYTTIGAHAGYYVADQWRAAWTAGAVGNVLALSVGRKISYAGTGFFNVIQSSSSLAGGREFSLVYTGGGGP